MKMENPMVLLDEAALDWRAVVRVARGAPLALSPAVRQRLLNARRIVERIVADGVRAYGINTGLGALCDQVLQPASLAELSLNTLKSHACGVGDALPDELVRAIICAQVANYSHGKSGISPELVDGLLALLNLNLIPLVPSRGSVGYLTHMAHIGLPLAGLWQVRIEGKVIDAKDALADAGLSPLVPGAKDGLSLVNGTPCVTGLLCVALHHAVRLQKWADIIAAMSFEALRGQTAAFDTDVLALKPHGGAQIVGRNLRALLAGSTVLAAAQGIRTQDALSLRAVPHIHGATRDQVEHVAKQVNTELASATDNPLVLGRPDDYRVLSQANPHGQSMAFAADLLSIALAELGGVAERRIDRLVNPLVSGLPAFLVENSGLNSGLMIVQYVAASLVAENKVLSQAMVVDNYVTSALQEDHLSLATPAALKTLQVIANTERILALEYLAAGQALQFYPLASLAPGTRAALAVLREHVDAYTQDRILAPDIAAATTLIQRDDGIRRIEALLDIRL
ncbi:HAL/PAL/TAL family ammonia-lyase [Janthinobacterium agaricidamnosum]|uniref:Histidine ammonia-lyase n=1 Tax=Janthinobacterium agaricidamnosum NBRC 102515 = DSM 9628 TaxID=1349767 RepID=W0V471_9BURK|nr:histidine ammonia-lyase [Janthinobacterium agaricidamnosum]CDG82395.1 histidine ammonia-lyase [Janthinobacterium agaricidamnosum NBRC 102515 = DSM 9628]